MLYHPKVLPLNFKLLIDVVAHTIHVWYIYLHLVDVYRKYWLLVNIGRYTSPMHPMGCQGDDMAATTGGHLAYG